MHMGMYRIPDLEMSLNLYQAVPCHLLSRLFHMHTHFAATFGPPEMPGFLTSPFSSADLLGTLRTSRPSVLGMLQLPPICTNEWRPFVSSAWPY